jgi:hypothetical protein
LSRSGSKGRRGAADGDAAAARATTVPSGDDDDDGSHRAVAERALAVADAPRPLIERDPAFRPVPVQHGQECIVKTSWRRRRDEGREIPITKPSIRNNDDLSLWPAVARQLS